MNALTALGIAEQAIRRPPVTAADLATALEGKTTGSSQYLARCPYHDDRSPSLSVGEGDDGRVLVTCHAGCEDVFERLLADGYIAGSPRTRADTEPDARYEYRDATGALAFEMLRLPGKQFRARRPDGDGGWIYDLPAELRVPYRLPEVLQASAEVPVFIVEGEKDADTLAAHGYVATTNPFGAGKWRPQYNQYFRGRDVIIVPDNDEAGRKHAESVKQHLDHVAASVRVMTLVGVVGEKGDVSDLIGEGGIEAFARLLEQLPPPEVRRKPYLSIRDLAQLPRGEWLVEGLMPRRGIGLLYGDSGVGKSFIAIDVSVRIAAGESVLDRQTASGLVFYVPLEGQTGLHDRIQAVFEEIGVVDGDRLPLVVSAEQLDLSNGDSVSGLISAVAAAAAAYRSAAALIVIDTLSRAMPGMNENSPEDMNKAVTALARIQRDTEATVLAIHHAGKTEARGARGHSSLRAAVDAELFVSRDRSGRTLTVMKQRDGADQVKIPFDLVTKSIAAHDDGGLTQTLVVRSVPTDDSRPTTRLKAATNKALRALKDAIRTSGRLLDAADADALEVPRGIRVVTWSEWLDACRAAGLAKGTDGAVRKAQSRAATELREAGVLGETGDYVWLNPAGSSGTSGQSCGTRTGQDT